MDWQLFKVYGCCRFEMFVHSFMKPRGNLMRKNERDETRWKSKIKKRCIKCVCYNRCLTGELIFNNNKRIKY